MALEKNLFCLVPIALVIEVWSRCVGVVQVSGCGPGGRVWSRWVCVRTYIMEMTALFGHSNTTTDH